MISLETELVNLEESPVGVGATSRAIFCLMAHMGAIWDVQHIYMISCDRHAGLTITTGVVPLLRLCKLTSAMTIFAVSASPPNTIS